MEKRINMGGEFYMADFGYFSMSVYKDAARQSRDFEDFISNLREKFRNTEESILL